MNTDISVQLQDWANSPTKKFLLDEWRVRIGQLVMNDEIKEAEKMRDMSLKVLKFGETYLCSQLNDSKLQEQMDNLMFTNKPDVFKIHQDVSTNDKEHQPKLDPKPETLPKDQDQSKEHVASVQPSFSDQDELSDSSSKKSDWVSESWKQNATPAEMRAHFSRMNHLILICGKYPRLDSNNNVRMMRFIEESPGEIQKLLINHKALTPQTESISIASNTRWINSSKTTRSYDELYNLCVAIHRRSLNARIKLVGFYDRNAHHLGEFNWHLKSIANDLSYVSFVPFEELVSSNEVQSFDNKISERTVITLLQRLSEY